MTTINPTDAEFVILVKYYDHTDKALALDWYGRTVLDSLESLGYIKSENGGWKLTDASKEYLDWFRQQVENRNFTNLSATQQRWVARDKLDPSDETERKLMVDMVLHDQSNCVSEAIIDLDQFRKALTQDEWNQLAHAPNRKVRMKAALHADIEEFADETDPKVVDAAKEHCEYKGHLVPHELLVKWYMNGNDGAVQGMNEHDLDVALDEGNAKFINAFARARANMFTTERILRVRDLAKTATGKDAAELNNAMCKLLLNVDDLPESLIKEFSDNRSIQQRFRGYRKAYRTLKELERMFADPDGETAREQRRLALKEND